MDKEKLQLRQQQIIDLTKGFCSEKLNEEYFELSERLVKKLGRKKNPPFDTGQIEIWAAAVIHALGTINFLFDKSAKPFTTLDELNNYFGTNKTTTTSKSKQIRDLLKLNRFDNEFSTKHMQANNPFANFVMVDGLIVPIDSLPEQYREMVRQARAEGRDISFTTR